MWVTRVRAQGHADAKLELVLWFGGSSRCGGCAAARRTHCPQRGRLAPLPATPSPHLLQLAEQLQQLGLVGCLVAGAARVAPLPHDVADLFAEAGGHAAAVLLHARRDGRLGVGHRIRALHQRHHVLQDGGRRAHGWGGGRAAGGSAGSGGSGGGEWEWVEERPRGSGRRAAAGWNAGQWSAGREVSPEPSPVAGCSCPLALQPRGCCSRPRFESAERLRSAGQADAGPRLEQGECRGHVDLQSACGAAQTHIASRLPRWAMRILPPAAHSASERAP